MDWLGELIGAMRKEEVRAFKLFAQRTLKGQERLDLALFDALRTPDSGFDESAFIAQYYQTNKNAYYRLRHRLSEDVLQSQLVLHFRTDDATTAANYLTLAQLYAKRGTFKLAIQLLNKAERSATDAEDYQVLDAVYSLFLRLSQEPNMGLNPQPYVDLRRVNQSRLAQLQRLEEVVALASHRLNLGQNYAPTTQEVQELLAQVVQDAQAVPELAQSPSYRVKVYEAVSRLLVQRRDFPALETYLRATYDEFEHNGTFAKMPAEMRFGMLTYLVNTLFFNDKFQDSLHFAEELGHRLEGYTGRGREKYWFFYHNSRVINYSKLDPARAITELESLKNDPMLLAEPFYRLFVLSNLVILYFSTEQFAKAMRELARLYTDDRYPTLDEALRFRLQLTELFIRFETEEIELLQRQADRLVRTFGPLVSPETREGGLLSALLALAKADTAKARKALIPRIQQVVDRLAAEPRPETDLLDFHQWFARRLGK